MRAVKLRIVNEDCQPMVVAELTSPRRVNLRSEQPLTLRFYAVTDLLWLPTPFDTGVILRKPGFNGVELGQQGVCRSSKDVNRAELSAAQCSRFACSLRAMLSPCRSRRPCA